MTHRVQDIELSMDDGATLTMHFILNPRLGPTPEAAVTVEREATTENIQREIDRTTFPGGRKVASWRLK